ncbi:MAG: VWA domain-containing protein, partial [Planctomycetes bacterium]|nr:VWA domain-containing protein [Planctomycetota bacterium]
RQSYESARDQGQRAGLLEQERPNIFTASVANLDPGENIKVSLQYVHALKYDRDAYTVRFPMVVAPRYIPGSSLGVRSGEGTEEDTDRVPDASRITPAMLRKGVRPGYGITLEVRLLPGVPIREMECLSHEIDEERPAEGETRLTLRRKDEIPNRDFVLRLRLASERPESILIASGSPGADGHFFLFLVPQASPAPQELVRREATFVLDRSGSMSGIKFEAAREALLGFLGSLRPDDSFAIIAFSESPVHYARDPVPATAEEVRSAEAWVRALSPQGGTEILSALQEAMPRLPEDTPGDLLRFVVVITDGQVGNEAEIFRSIQPLVGHRRIHVFGIDTAPNDYFLEKLARLGGGTCRIFSDPREIPKAIEDLSERMSRPVLSNVVVDLENGEAKEVCPSRIPDLFAGQPVLAKGQLRISGSTRAVMRATGPAGEFREEVPLMVLSDPEEAAGVVSMWARAKVDELEDRLDVEPANEAGIRAEIVRLGTTHGIVTQYTSFLVVDSEPSRETRNGPPTAVAVPVPIPAGWEEGAHGPVRYWQGAAGVPGASVPPAAAPLPARSAAGRGMRSPPPANGSGSGSGRKSSGGGWGPRIGGGAIDPVSGGVVLALAATAILARRRQKREAA